MKPPLVSAPDCRLCPLHEDAAHVCIPTTYKAGGSTHDQAVLIVGQSPGAEEDARGRPFVGPAGARLDAWYITAPALPRHADVYLTNIVRCHPPGNRRTTAAENKACRPHFDADLHSLCAAYRRVAVLCVGSDSLAQLAPRPDGRARSLAEQFRHQAEPLDGYPNAHLWATYHPAATLESRGRRKGRDPRLLHAVERHLFSLVEWLEYGELSFDSAPTPLIAPPPAPTPLIGPLAWDLETYGCLKSNRDQTVFHPIRFRHVDRARPPEWIVCASIAWRDPQGAHTGYFRWDDPSHRETFLKWLDHHPHYVLQHGQYDLKVLRAWLRARHQPTVWLETKHISELLLDTHCFDDVQPERDLKSTSWLYRTSDYGREDSCVQRFTGPSDPELIRYSCLDAFATLRNYEVLQDALAAFADHPLARSKLSDYRRRHASDSVWAAVRLEERGVVFDFHKLQLLHDDLTAQADQLRAEALEAGLQVGGEGSRNSIVSTIHGAADALTAHAAAAYAPDSPEMREVTDVLDSLSRTKTGLSAAEDNRGLLLGALPTTDPLCAPYALRLALLGNYNSVTKLTNTYTRALLLGKQDGPHYRYKTVPTKSKKAKSPTRRLRIPDSEYYLYDRRAALIPYRTRARTRRALGIALPHYFIAPKPFGEGGRAGGAAGTARWSAKDPAIQTLPRPIKACMTTRHTPGVLWELDLAQVEWRAAAFLSNDSRMLAEIAEGFDVHTDAATFLLDDFRPNPITHTREWLETPAAQRILTASPDYEMRERAARAPALTPTEYADYVLFVRKWLRQNLGKSQNFAELYGGSPPTTRRICRVNGGMDISLSRCERFHTHKQQRYPQRHAWRERLLNDTAREGVLHLPVLGQSRTFWASEADIRHTYREQVLDFPVQVTAFNLLLSGLIGAQRAFGHRSIRSCIITQMHDSIIVDSPEHELSAAQSLAGQCMETSEYRAALERTYDRRFPLEYEIKTLSKA